MVDNSDMASPCGAWWKGFQAMVRGQSANTIVPCAEGTACRGCQAGEERGSRSGPPRPLVLNRRTRGPRAAIPPFRLLPPRLLAAPKYSLLCVRSLLLVRSPPAGVGRAHASCVCYVRRGLGLLATRSSANEAMVDSRSAVSSWPSMSLAEGLVDECWPMSWPPHARPTEETPCRSPSDS